MRTAGSLLLACMIICTISSTYAQPSIEWQGCYGGSGDEQAFSIQQTCDGGYVVTGETNSNDGDVSGNHGESDFWVLKLDSHGDIDGQTCLGGSDFDFAYSVDQTDDGGYIVAGHSLSDDGDVTGHHGSTESSDCWITKLNSFGLLEWQRSLGGSADDKFRSIRQTDDGGYIAAGYTMSNDGDISGHHGSTGSYDCWIVKMNSFGEIDWEKSYHEYSDYAFSIEQTTDGGYIVAGYKRAFTSAFLIVKLDSDGTFEWQFSFGGINDDYACCIKQTDDEGYIIAGASQSEYGSISDWDYRIIKLDLDGLLEWERSLGGTTIDRAQSIDQTVDGGYIVGGYSFSNDGDVSGHHGRPIFCDYWVVKLNPIGSIEWQLSLGGTDNEMARAIQQTMDGGFIVAGYTDSNDDDVSGNHGGGDFWVVKLSAYEDIDEIARIESFSLSAYPNPFNSALTINATANSQIDIFAIDGRKIHTLDVGATGETGETGGRPHTGNHEIIWSPSPETPSGVYLIRARFGKRETVSKRVVYMK